MVSKMAEPPIPQQQQQQSFLSGKMDANSVDHGTEEVRSDYPREDIQQLQHRGLQKLKTTDGYQKKKGSFQITKVVTKSSGVNDDLDDPDETNTEDLSSEIVDVSKTTDIEHDMSSTEDTVTSLGQGQEDVSREAGKTYQQIPNQTAPPPSQNNQQILQTQVSQDQEPTDNVNTVQSRFRVVKIESKEPFKRGRWMCLDYIDPPSSEKATVTDRTEKPNHEEVGSGNSSASSSIHYVHGVDDPSKNPLLANIVHAEGHPILEPQAIHPLQNGGGQNPLLQQGTEATNSHGLQGNLSSTQTSQQTLSGQVSATTQANHIQNVIAPQGSVSSQHLDLNAQSYAQSTTSMTPSGGTNGHAVSQGQSVHNQVALHSTLSQQSHNTPSHHSDQAETFGLMPPTSELSSQSQPNLPQTADSMTGQSQQSVQNQNIVAAPQEFVQQVSVTHPVVTTAKSNTSSPSNENMQGTDLIAQEHGYAGASDEKPHTGVTERTVSDATTSMLKQISAAHTILSPPLLEYVSASLQQVPMHPKDDDER